MFQQIFTDLSEYISGSAEMVRIEGTYSCVKDQSFVDFLIGLGKFS